ncbi:unnamed protein product, partial [Chrysoparadoxa australica]
GDLTADETFEIELRLETFLGGVDSKSIAVAVTSASLPTVTMVQGKAVSAKRGVPLVLRASSITSPCSSDEEDLVYTWSITSATAAQGSLILLR